MPKPKLHSVKDGATNRYRLLAVSQRRTLRIDTGMVFAYFRLTSSLHRQDAVSWGETGLLHIDAEEAKAASVSK